MSGMSGTFEHITEMDHIINHSRKHQRSVNITLTDLKNAFGEVYHALIQSVPRHHYIQDETNEILVKHCIVTFVYQYLRTIFIPNTLL